MAKTKSQEKNLDALKNELHEKREHLFTMKLDHARRKLKNTSDIFNTRKDIARILTAIKMKGIAHE